MSSFLELINQWTSDEVVSKVVTFLSSVGLESETDHVVNGTIIRIYSDSHLCTDITWRNLANTTILIEFDGNTFEAKVESAGMYHPFSIDDLAIFAPSSLGQYDIYNIPYIGTTCWLWFGRITNSGDPHWYIATRRCRDASNVAWRLSGNTFQEAFYKATEGLDAEHTSSSERVPSSEYAFDWGKLDKNYTHSFIVHDRTIHLYGTGPQHQIYYIGSRKNSFNSLVEYLDIDIPRQPKLVECRNLTEKRMVELLTHLSKEGLGYIFRSPTGEAYVLKSDVHMTIDSLIGSQRSIAEAMLNLVYSPIERRKVAEELFPGLMRVYKQIEKLYDTISNDISTGDVKLSQEVQKIRDRVFTLNKSTLPTNADVRKKIVRDSLMMNDFVMQSLMYNLVMSSIKFNVKELIRK